MGRKSKGLAGALLESERLKDVAECGRECEVCGWNVKGCAYICIVDRESVNVDRRCIR